jgi:dihydrofolate reductase
MGKLVVSMFASLDGVMEDPRWTAPYWSDDIARFKHEELAAADALLLGRVTAELFAGAWPTKEHAEAMRGAFASLPRPGEFSERMNSLPKHVASRTRDKLGWNGCGVIRGDLAAEVSRLKLQSGSSILVVGSGSVARAMLKAGLVDEYRLLMYPVVLGHGMRLFDKESRATLELIEARPLKSSVVALRYRPAAE